MATHMARRVGSLLFPLAVVLFVLYLIYLTLSTILSLYLLYDIIAKYISMG